MSNMQPTLFAGLDQGAAPLVLSYGMGVDSTGLLVHWWQEGIRPDLIIFADPGAENPRTYAYRKVIDRFLERVGFPPVTVVRYQPGHGHYDSILTDCILKGMMPSLSYGRKGCSQKYKAGPINAFLKTWPPAVAAWSKGQRLRHAIGYDAGPKDSRRGTENHDNALEEFIYPLREVGWDRERCIHEITCNPILKEIGQELGMDHVPPKSACVFCPATKPCEVEAMAEDAPESLVQALLVEAEALPRSTVVLGLWRKPTKARPASWNEFAADLSVVLPDTMEVASKLFPLGGANAPTSSLSPGHRYAVGRRADGHSFFGDFRSAALASRRDLPLFFWLNGAWFQSLAPN